MRIEKSAQTVFTALEDGTAVLLNLNTLFYYSLNRTGASLWQQIENTDAVTGDDLARAVCERFDVDEGTAWQSIGEFLERLEEFKMIRIE
jgi:hypothetical protein